MGSISPPLGECYVASPLPPFLLDRPVAPESLRPYLKWSDEDWVSKVETICVSHEPKPSSAGHQIDGNEGDSATTTEVTDAIVFPFSLNSEEESWEEITLDEDGGTPQGISAARSLTLPLREFQGLWGSLHYDGDIKEKRLFERVAEVVSAPNVLVILLLDEVESLATQRKAAEGEPADATRAVNALLTQIDALKRHPNALVLATSNISGAIDRAFLDRADLKLFVGPPSTSATYEILRSSVNELIRCGLVNGSLLGHYSSLLSAADEETETPESQLHKLARSFIGLSGRALRKLPFLAIADLPHFAASPGSRVRFETFLESLSQAAAETSKNAC
ncbi:unnamed protein product [Cyprideis torosa]|uniref:ATPase AAA-type core domain-containing protein n=1 Tax=Cyprideis torosa TaxID=163714 RepID=A0A7R8ZJG8_9CRUS|nr:unnamed protein product [Cyprideis torosa]CAG0879786.1 unnamed protein product [Cyprideis torosa]